MKELINVAEELCKQIDKAQVHLINARLSNDEEGKKSAISEMETTMCNAIQLLTCLVERKDNVVDLGEVWHSNKDIPHKDRKIIAVACNEILCGTFMVEAGWYRANINSVKVLASWESIKKWAYVEDLLPRGGEA